MREKEGESVGEGDDDEVESNRKRQKFGVKSKTFEVEVEKRRGKTLIFIVESKKGVSSWVRLGPASVGMFLEGLEQCIKDGKNDKWEKGWKENWRRYSMVREVNKAGSFIRLGVVDAEEKRFSICIPRGRGGREGWPVMADVVRNLFKRTDKREENNGEPIPERVSSEMGNRNSIWFRMEFKEEDIRRNVDQLGQCLVGKWNPKAAEGRDLARMGWRMENAWELKGKLGLAWMDEGQALLEFEKAAEARKIFNVGERLVGGIHVDLERWSPSYGCLEEGDIEEELWVRIKGLSLSL